MKFCVRPEWTSLCAQRKPDYVHDYVFKATNRPSISAPHLQYSTKKGSLGVCAALRHGCSYENCIPLCFDCHSDMGKADPKHPKGKQYSVDELKRHRDNWYKKINAGSYLANDSENAIYNEDVELFRKICDLFTPNIRYWLNEKDLGGAHPLRAFQDLTEFLLDMNDPLSEFIDSEIEKLRGALIAATSKFLAYKSINTFVRYLNGEDYCVTRQWMVEHEDWEPHSMGYEEYTIQFAEEAQKLNDFASDVWTTYCEFVRQGRYRLAQRH